MNDLNSIANVSDHRRGCAREHAIRNKSTTSVDRSESDHVTINGFPKASKRLVMGQLACRNTVKGCVSSSYKQHQ